MNEAPRRIWAEPGEATQGMWWDRDHGTGDIPYVRGDTADERIAALKAALVKARDTLLDDHPGDPCQMEVIKMIEDIIAKAEEGTK